MHELNVKRKVWSKDGYSQPAAADVIPSRSRDTVRTIHVRRTHVHNVSVGSNCAKQDNNVNIKYFTVEKKLIVFAVTR